jgi:hypothetical protein
MKLIDNFGNLHSLYLCLLCLFMIFIGIYGETLISSTCTNTNIYTYFRFFTIISSISLTLIISYLICRIRCYKDGYHILSQIKEATDIKVPVVLFVFCITQLSLLLTLKSQISSCTDHDTSTFDVCAQIGLVGIGIAGFWCVYIFLKRIYLWNLKRQQESEKHEKSLERDSDDNTEEEEEEENSANIQEPSEEPLMETRFHSDEPDGDFAKKPESKSHSEEDNQQKSELLDSTDDKHPGGVHTSGRRKSVVGQNESTQQIPPSLKNRLPDGWTIYIDPGSGNPYYYNETTGSTQWELPTRPRPPKAILKSPLGPSLPQRGKRSQATIHQPSDSPESQAVAESSQATIHQPSDSPESQDVPESSQGTAPLIPRAPVVPTEPLIPTAPAVPTEPLIPRAPRAPAVPTEIPIRP